MRYICVIFKTFNIVQILILIVSNEFNALRLILFHY